MTRLHIVLPYHSAAMQRMSVPLEQLETLYEITTGTAPDDSADCNLPMPWHTMLKWERDGNSKHIIAYTHCNPGAEKDLLDACERADLVTAMSFEGRRELSGWALTPKRYGLSTPPQMSSITARV